MYPIENIIRSASDENKEELSILVVNEALDEYVVALAENTSHTFYLLNNITSQPQWTNVVNKPYNVCICGSLADIGSRYVDAIIAFNRGEAFDKAKQLSDTLHAPLIVVDFVSSHSRVPNLFGRNLDPNRDWNQLYVNNGDACVANTDFIKRSWISNVPSFSSHIQYVPVPFQPKSRSKVLIDIKFPKQYIESLGLNLNSNIYTTNKDEAAVYLHLWQYQTPLLFDCMASNVPVVTFQSPDFQDIAAMQACMFVQDPKIFNDNFQRVMEHDSLPAIANNAFKYATSIKAEDFSNNWNNILNHTCNKGFVRG